MNKRHYEVKSPNNHEQWKVYIEMVKPLSDKYHADIERLTAEYEEARRRAWEAATGNES